jgi:hypothetical protein
MKTTATYNSQSIEIDILSLAPKNASSIPPAGVHPVVQAQGELISLLSPVDISSGSTLYVHSGYPGLPYCVTVNSCISDGQGKFLILGIIGQ